MDYPHDSTFYNSPRYQQSIKAAPLHDAVFADTLEPRRIIRKEHFEPESVDYKRALWLDRNYGIDGELTLQTGQKLTFSEKCLSYKHSELNSVTMEKYNDSETYTKGDYANCRADLYLVSYLNQDGSELDRWILIDLSALKLADAKHGLPWKSSHNKHDGAKASFVHIDANDLFRYASGSVLAQSAMLTPDNVDCHEAQRLESSRVLETF